MTRQKTAPQEQHQGAGEEQNAGPCRQRPARPARLAPEQKRAAQRGQQEEIEQTQRLIGNLQHDLADMGAAFHQPMRRRRFRQREGLENARARLAGFQHWPDLGRQR